MSARSVLICAHLPQYDRDSGSRRVFDLILLLQEAGWTVTFVSQHAKHPARYAQVLRQRGVAVYSGSRWIEQLAVTCEFDLAIFSLWHIAEPWLAVLRRHCPQTRIIVDSVDLHFLRLARQVFRESVEAGSCGKLSLKYSSEMIREINTYAAADAVLAVSQKEADLLNDLVADPAQTHVVPINETMPASTVAFADRAGILFVGYFHHAPNTGAVEYLLKDILPLIDPALLDKQPIQIVGDGLPENLLDYGRRFPQVRMVGWVPSVIPYFAKARISVIPLRYGAGVKGKLVQALMAGTPTVTTSIGAEGLNLRDGEHILLADTPDSFASAMSRLLTEPDLWQRLAKQGRDHIVTINGRDAMQTQLMKVVHTVFTKKPKPLVPGEPVGIQLPQGAFGKQGDSPLVLGGQSPCFPNAQTEYQQLISRIREVAGKVVPAGSKVIVVSKGDNELTKLEGRTAWHFPQGDNSEYAGYYPADSAAAISLLEALKAQGGRFLLFPSTALWWLEHYTGFSKHLAKHYREVYREQNTCAIYELQESHSAAEKAPLSVGNGQKNGRTVWSSDHPSARLIAFYLPQFHPIRENDRWWGRGFTEWTNVAKARPLFPEHHQPHLPADLSFYDLRLPEIRAAQAQLAREHGIHGFCYYHYWFHGKRLLERPFHEVLTSGEPSFPFCLCWANEPWSRRWDGSSHDVLQPQTYSDEDDRAHIAWLIPALSDPRALTVEGKPLFLVYRAQDLPNPSRTADTWRRAVEQAGLPGIYLVAVETGWSAGWDVTRAGFDAAVLFQPQFSMLNACERMPVADPHLRVFDYQNVWPALASPDPVSYPRYATVFPSWDNSPRKGSKGWVIHNSTPQAYESWLTKAITDAQSLPAQDRIVFLNAWNEWGEGCHLEPDQRHGRAYLEATRRAVQRAARIEAPSTVEASC